MPPETTAEIESVIVLGLDPDLTLLVGLLTVECWAVQTVTHAPLILRLIVVGMTHAPPRRRLMADGSTSAPDFLTLNAMAHHTHRSPSAA